MTNKDLALQWAKLQIEKNELVYQVKINDWEIIDHPILFLQTNISRMQEGSIREQRLAYDRIRRLKQKIN